MGSPSLGCLALFWQVLYDGCEALPEAMPDGWVYHPACDERVYREPAEQLFAAEGEPPPTVDLQWLLDADSWEPTRAPPGQWPTWFHSRKDDTHFLQLQALERSVIIKEVELKPGSVWGAWELSLRVGSTDEPVPVQRLARFAVGCGCEVRATRAGTTWLITLDNLGDLALADIKTHVEARGELQLRAFLSALYYARPCEGAYAGQRVPADIEGRCLSDNLGVTLEGAALAKSNFMRDRGFILRQHAQKGGAIRKVSARCSPLERSAGACFIRSRS